MGLLSLMTGGSRNIDKYIKKQHFYVLFESDLSVVYRNPDKTAIIKKFKPSANKVKFNSLDYKEMYETEKRYLSKLAENKNIADHIPRVLDCNDSETFIVMEYKGLDGIEILNAGLFSDEVLQQLIEQITMVLNEIVAMGYSHRDIKPENLVYDINTHKWSLIDFTFMEESNGSAHKLSFKGTYPYSSPILGNRHIMNLFAGNNDREFAKVAADYYSFAVTIFSMLGCEHKESDNKIELNLVPIYQTLVDDNADPVLKALAKIITSSVDIRYSRLLWGRTKNMLCTFHDEVTGPIDMSLYVERDIRKCWEEYMSIIEKQKTIPSGDNVQIENKSQESN